MRWRGLAVRGCRHLRAAGKPTALSDPGDDAPAGTRPPSRRSDRDAGSPLHRPIESWRARRLVICAAARVSSRSVTRRCPDRPPPVRCTAATGSPRLHRHTDSTTCVDYAAADPVGTRPGADRRRAGWRAGVRSLGTTCGRAVDDARTTASQCWSPARSAPVRPRCTAVDEAGPQAVDGWHGFLCRCLAIRTPVRHPRRSTAADARRDDGADDSGDGDDSGGGDNDGTDDDS